MRPLQVNDFAADAIISQLLLLDSQDPNKVPRRQEQLAMLTFSLMQGCMLPLCQMM